MANVGFLPLLAGLCHLFLFVYNRYLLCLRDGPMKQPIHALWFALTVPLPLLLLLLYSTNPAVQQVLAWDPRSGNARLLFAVQVILVGFWLARSSVWLIDRLWPERPAAILEETIEHIPMAPVASGLPALLRFLDTTSALEVTHRELAIAGLSDAFDGFTIAQVSDVHFSARLDFESYFESVVKTVQGLDPDVVVLTGDFVESRRQIRNSLRYHARLRGRLGTFAVMGNHDYWTRPDLIQSEMERHGIRWLGGGERRVFRRRGRSLVFTGTDRPWTCAGPDWQRLIRRAPGDAVVLLSHTPDGGPAAARHGASLILSGHNHGGQYCLPGIGPVVVPSRYGVKFAGGCHRVGRDSLLNVSRGVGVSGDRGWRMLCAPEICLLTLRAPASEVMVGVVARAQREAFGEAVRAG